MPGLHSHQLAEQRRVLSKRLRALGAESRKIATSEARVRGRAGAVAGAGAERRVSEVELSRSISSAPEVAAVDV